MQQNIAEVDTRSRAFRFFLGGGGGGGATSGNL